VLRLVPEINFALAKKMLTNIWIRWYKLIDIAAIQVRTI
jgi:hypothetical protein